MLYSGNVDILEYINGSVFKGICQDRNPSKYVCLSVEDNIHIGDYDVNGRFCGFGM